MSETYCGKSCELCPQREANNCPGCKSLPYSEGCTIAPCCRNSGYDNCSSCAFSTTCEKLGGRDSVPDHRYASLAKDSASREYSAAHAEEACRRLTTLFWLQIVSLAISVLSNDLVVGVLPWLELPVLAASVVLLLLYGLTLLKLSPFSRFYRRAGILNFATLIASAVSPLFILINPLNLLLFLLPVLAAAILALVSTLTEFRGHIELLSAHDRALAAKWESLRAWYIGVVVVSVVAGLFSGRSSTTVYILLLTSAASFIIGIVVLIYLWRTAQFFKAMAGNGAWEL